MLRIDDTQATGLQGDIGQNSRFGDTPRMGGADYAYEDKLGRSLLTAFRTEKLSSRCWLRLPTLETATVYETVERHPSKA